MGNLTKLLIRGMHQRSVRRVGELAAELVEARSEDKEAILAELEFHRWLADYCAWCS
jgi:hypothetical protein